MHKLMKRSLTGGMVKFVRSRSGRIRYRGWISGSSRRDLSAWEVLKFGLCLWGRGWCYRGLEGRKVSQCLAEKLCKHIEAKRMSKVFLKSICIPSKIELALSLVGHSGVNGMARFDERTNSNHPH